MTPVHHLSGIPMPPFSYLPDEFARNSQAHQNSCHLGAVMKDHSRKDERNPNSPLMCILLLLMVGAATQIKVPAILF
jgi:hypothetical protein